MDTLVNVLHLATFDTHGGAAVAALRLVEGLRRRGHEARLLVREKTTPLPYVEALTDASAVAAHGDAEAAHLAWLFTQRARTTRSDTLFSSDVWTYNIADHRLIQESDVLHLHWVTGFL